MKKWIILAFGAAFISSCIHLYLTNRSYQLTAGTAQTSAICNINEKINCDSALLSPYAKIFNVSLSSFGVGFNLSLSLILLFFLWGFFNTSYWKTTTVYLSGFIGLTSLVMIAISFLENLYCPLCWATYLLSFVAFVPLFFIFKKEVLSTSFQKFILDSIREKSGIFLGSFILIISFFLHMIFVVTLGIKDSAKQFEAILLDWDGEEALNFSTPPLLKSGPANSKMTLVEFADFMCPSCQRVQPSLKAFLETHKNVTFHFYVFPLDQTCNDEISFKGTGVTCLLSRSAICAEQQGKGWLVHDFIFKEQESFKSNLADKDKVANLLKNMIQVIGLDSQKFTSCIENPKTKQLVKEMAKMGSKANIPGTPTFFINGKLLTSSNNLSAILNYVYNYID